MGGKNDTGGAALTNGPVFTAVESLATTAGVWGDLVVPPLSPVVEMGKNPVDGGIVPVVPVGTFVAVSCGPVEAWGANGEAENVDVVCKGLVGVPNFRAGCDIVVGFDCEDSAAFPKPGAVADAATDNSAGFPKTEAGCWGIMEVDGSAGFPKMEAGCWGIMGFGG